MIAWRRVCRSLGARHRWFWLGVVVYLSVVTVAAVITGPTVIRGADGLEIGPLLMLGFPCSVPLMFVCGWSMAPFGYTAVSWGGLIGLIAGSVANVLIFYAASGHGPTRSATA